MGCLVLIVMGAIAGAAIAVPWLALPFCAFLIWRSPSILNWMRNYEGNANSEFMNKIMVYGLIGFTAVAALSSFGQHHAPGETKPTVEIPSRFQGVWASEVAMCDNHASRVRITDTNVGFDSGGMEAAKITVLSENDIIVHGSVDARAGGSTYAQRDDVRLTLSADGNGLHSGEYDYVRCPNSG